MKRASGDDPALQSLDPADLAEDIQRRIRALPVQNTPSIRAVRRQYSAPLRRAEASIVLALARALHAGGEHRWVAYELIHAHPEAMRCIGDQELAEFGRGIDSWWSVDAFSLELAGPAWRDRQVRDGLILGWARSPDRWWRRAALVSTVPLNARAHGGTGDPGRTLKICETLVADRDDMVVKALSWALRVLIACDRRAVKAFLKAHASTIPARVRREVTNKLETGLKNPRR